MAKEFDVFISYRRDGGFHEVQNIRNFLEARGLSVFVDLQKIHSGEFGEQIYEAIDGSRNVIVVLSAGSIERCTKEDDWCRREIVRAVRAGKHIIPLWLNGFEWPKGYKKRLPEEVRRLKKLQAVEESRNYFDATMERLLLELKDVEEKLESSSEEEINTVADTEKYFSENMRDLSKVLRVDMAFHSGFHWFVDAQKIALLRRLLKGGIQMRVMINSRQVLESVCALMQTEGMQYPEYDTMKNYWLQLQREFPVGMEVRMCDVPFMRRVYFFRMAEKMQSSVSVKHYTYGKAIDIHDVRSIFGAQSDYYLLFLDEFDFLWQRSKPLE